MFITVENICIGHLKINASAHLIAIMVMIVTVRPNSERDVPTIEMTVSAN